MIYAGKDICIRIVALAIIPLAICLLAACAAQAPPALPLENIKFDGKSNKAVVIPSTRVANKKVPEPHLLFITYDPKAKVVPEDKPPGTRKRFAVKAKMGFFSAPDRTGWAHHSLLVDPGTYILAAAAYPGGTATSYRLNSVYFTIKPGEVVYVGGYEFSKPNLYEVETTLFRNDAHAKVALERQPGIKKSPKFFSYKESGRFTMSAMQLISQVKIDASAK